MNLVNLFGSKAKTPEPEYFLAIEIHESLIKTALWEVLDGEPQIINVGSFESWTDEESLINGVDSSLDQAVKVIKDQPRRVILGLPDSWMEQEKIHSSKTKLINHLFKELGLDPIGVVTINRAIAHYLKKKEGMPPTVILLEVYTSKVAVSYVYLGVVNKTEEVARSGDLAHDVEEGLTRMDLPNYPARFILTNGSGLDDESQQITAFPWTDRLPFKHIPKVETLPIDFSIQAIALAGGVEAVQYMGLEVKSDASSGETLSAPEESNLVIPEETPTSMEELGFSYEESLPPANIPLAVPQEPPKTIIEEEEDIDTEASEPEYAFSDDLHASVPKKKSQFKITLPSFPSLKLSLPKINYSFYFLIPALFISGLLTYLFFAQVEISIRINPQKINQQLTIAIADTSQSGTPTLVANKKTFSGSAKETTSTTGTATVGDKAKGTITIGNKTVAPIVLKAGSTIVNDTGKYTFVLGGDVTIASASADSLDTISGKSTGIGVTAGKIGAEYNLPKGTIFTVGNFSKSIAAAVAEVDFTGGTSRTVNAVAKADQDKVLGLATDKIKSQVQSETQAETPGFKTLPLSEVQFTKKEFDRNLSEEATTVSLDLAGSLDALVYSEDNLYALAINEITPQIPAGSFIKKETTKVSLENPTKVGDNYQSVVNVEAVLYPTIDELKLSQFIKGKRISKIRPFFETIPGFTGVDVKIFPPIPYLTQILPLKNIKFDLLSN